jgi:predicted GNAT family acetyltransferase
MAPMTHTVLHQEADSKGAFYIARSEGGHLAEMTYSRANPTLIIVDHTEVDPSLAGQGVGRKLLDALVAWARETKTKVMPLCPYAKSQFDKDASIRDVLM